MNGFFDNLKYKWRQWATRRYGMDELSRFLYIVALICIILSFFGWLWLPLRFFWYLAVVLIIIGFFRFASTNHYARAKERDKYLQLKTKATGIFNIQKRRWNERKTHVFYTCPNCKTTIRVPRGRGKIEITCPKCRTKFIKTT